LDAFDSCLRNRRLKTVEPDPERVEKEVETAISELSRARTCYADGNFEECVIQAYFAMNRTLRALLLNEGYRDTNLYSLLAGLDRLFVQTDRMERRLLEILKEAKEQKDLILEGARCARRETRLILSGAEDAMHLARETLELGPVPLLDEQPMPLDDPDNL